MSGMSGIVKNFQNIVKMSEKKSGIQQLSADVRKVSELLGLNGQYEVF